MGLYEAPHFGNAICFPLVDEGFHLRQICNRRVIAFGPLQVSI